MVLSGKFFAFKNVSENTAPLICGLPDGSLLSHSFMPLHATILFSIIGCFMLPDHLGRGGRPMGEEEIPGEMKTWHSRPLSF